MTYSLLSEEYRFSRAIILFTVVFAGITIPILRYFLHLLKIRTFYNNKAQRIAIIGNAGEISRISLFLKKTLIEPEKIINISAGEETTSDINYASKIHQLKDVVGIYEINEVIFCSKDLSSTQIIEQMALLRESNVEFKIAPPASLYIIGSNSKETSGEYYILASDTVLKPSNQKNKRMLDLTLSILFILVSPLLILLIKRKGHF